MWVMVSCHRGPAPLLTLTSRHMGEQSHLAAGDGLVLALSMSCPVASVRPVPCPPQQCGGRTLWEAAPTVRPVPASGPLFVLFRALPPVISHRALNSNR